MAEPQTGKKRKFNETKTSAPPRLRINPSQIKNKMKRMEQWQILKSAKKKIKKEARLKRQKEHEALGEDAPPKQQPRTLENTREADETVVEPQDEEIKAETSIDEWSTYFDGTVKPKICITTSYDPSRGMYDFIRELLYVFPNSFFYARRGFPLKKIIEEAKAKGFTDIMVINEDRKKLNAITLVHLPRGPTAYFKLTNVVLPKDIEGHGRATSHKPEVILNRFTTRLGVRVSRMLGSLFHQEPNFKGRRVVTFHNQRDFIFVRHHRYIFSKKKDETTARLQELGPRFTLKLKWLMHGTFDTKHGQYEWKHNPELDTSRRRFFL